MSKNNEIQHANVFMIGFTTCVECPINQKIIQDFYRRQEKLSSGMKCRTDDELDISVDIAVLAHHWRRMVRPITTE